MLLNFYATLTSMMTLDIDECTVTPDICDQECINMPGSFMCNCSEGYLLNGDGLTCDGEKLH